MVLDERDRAAVQEALGLAVQSAAKSLGSEARARSALLALQCEHLLRADTLASDSGMLEVVENMKASND